MLELLSGWFSKFSRRQFLTRTSLASLSLPFLSLTRAAKVQAADVTCVAQDIKTDLDVIALKADEVLFWVHNASDLGIGLLSILVLRKQGASSFVRRVILANESLESIAEKYYTAQSSDSRGSMPYLIFDGVSLEQSRYFLFLEVIEGSVRKIYRYTFVPEQLVRSKFNSIFLPKIFVDAFTKPFANEISTSFYNAKSLFLSTSCLTKNLYFNSCFEEHRITCYFKTFNSNNDFELLINFAHPDEQDHYMRYFILTDPVGRILGVKQRAYQESPLGQTVIRRITSDEMKKWGIALTALINDCPYVMLFWEDGRHALRQRLLWLH